MASMYKRGATYWAKWYDPPGVKHDKSLGSKDKKEALARFKEIEARLARGRRVTFPGSRTLGEVLDDFLADKRARREPRTARTYEGHAKHIRRLLPIGARIGTLEAAHVDRFLQVRCKETSPQTANKERTTLMVLFGWAIKRDHADHNPVLRVEPFSARPRPRPEISVSDFAEMRTDLEAAISAATTPLARFRAVLLRDGLLMAWWSGLRIGEIARLAPSDIAIEREEYVVRSAENKGPRLLPMHAEVKEILERRLALKRERIFSSFSGEDGYWVLEDTWKCFVRRHAKHALRSFHALRHAFNTRMHDVIDNPLVAMRATGHRTIQMSSHYTHVGVEKVRQALKRLA